MTDTEEDLLDEIRNDQQDAIRKAIAELRLETPAEEEIWDISADGTDNILGILNSRRNVSGADDFRESLKETKKTFIIASRANVLDDEFEEEVREFFTEAENAVEQISQLEELMKEAATVAPQTRTALKKTREFSLEQDTTEKKEA